MRAPGPGRGRGRRSRYGGICGSDLHYWLHGAVGESILRAPMVLGHEVVGTVVEAAADGSGPPAGTRVAVHPASPGDDGVTRYPADRPNLSPLCRYLGSAARFPHSDGAFVRYATLPSRMLRTLPDGLDLRTAALVEPASVAWHAVSRGGDVARQAGAGDRGRPDRRADRRGAAPRRRGRDRRRGPARAPAGECPAARRDAHPARRPRSTRSRQSRPTSRWSPAAARRGLGSAIRGTARGGRVVMVGLLPTGDQPVPMSLAISRELELVGAFRFNDEIDEVIAALADGSLVVDPVITHEFGVDDTLDAFATARDASLSSKVLLRF